MYKNNELVQVVLDCVVIVGCTVLMFVPFSNDRVRDRWAKIVTFAIGLVGVICYSTYLMLDMHWLVLNSHSSYEVYRQLSFANGLLLGWLTALVISGQVFRRKPPENEHLNR